VLSVQVFDRHLVSVGEDGLVKIFNVESDKSLIREIEFADSVQCACLMGNKLDLVIGHSDLISYVAATKYIP